MFGPKVVKTRDNVELTRKNFFWQNPWALISVILTSIIPIIYPAPSSRHSFIGFYILAYGTFLIVWFVHYFKVLKETNFLKHSVKAKIPVVSFHEEHWRSGIRYYPIFLDKSKSLKVVSLIESSKFGTKLNTEHEVFYLEDKCIPLELSRWSLKPFSRG